MQKTIKRRFFAFFRANKKSHPEYLHILIQIDCTKSRRIFFFANFFCKKDSLFCAFWAAQVIVAIYFVRNFFFAVFWVIVADFLFAYFTFCRLLFAHFDSSHLFFCVFYFLHFPFCTFWQQSVIFAHFDTCIFAYFGCAMAFLHIFLRQNLQKVNFEPTKSTKTVAIAQKCTKIREI